MYRQANNNQHQLHHQQQQQQNAATTSSSSASSETSRLAVADILSTMAVTPSTFAALEGFSTAVLTQTTPTLTPTTLRSIEQTFIELQTVPPPHAGLISTRHQNEAGFVPPVVTCPLPTLQSIQTTTITESPSSILGALNGNSSVTTYQELTTKSVASIAGSNPIFNDVVNGMSSSASSSGSSTTSVSDAVNDNSGWGNGKSGRNGGGMKASRSHTTTTSTRGNAKGRNMGGRRPAKYEKLTPEEEERRRVRRERNKLAAARCRKRRMDHTNSLIYETEGLEDQRSSLQSEIQDLQSQKDELEFILEAHKVVCKLQRQHCHRDHRDFHSHECDQHEEVEHQHQQHVILPLEETVDIKPDVSQLNVVIQQQQNSSAKRSRPNSLALSSTFVVPRVIPNHQQQQQQQQQPSHQVVTTSSSSTSQTSRLSLTEATGIAISTPSNGMFNFEALMEGGTGLTPVSCTPGTCATQQRSSGSDCLSSPEGNGGGKLVSL